MKHRSITLDACRGVAVVGVILYHFNSYGFLPPLPNRFAYWTATGMFGVDLFYVLSGFFITQAILRPPTWEPGAFLRARITRIYPAYIVSLVIVLAKWIWDGQILDHYLIVDFLLHLLMLHNFLPGVGASLNGVYWTLGVEFSYYILMLALAPFIRERHNFWRISFSMLAIAILWRVCVFLYLPASSRFFASTQVLGALDAFALGGVAAVLISTPKWRQRLSELRWPLLIFGVALLTITLHYYLFYSNDYWSRGWFVVGWRSCLNMSFALVVVACATMPDHKLLSYSGIPWLGKISFSLYLYHLLPVSLVNHYFSGEAWELKILLAIVPTLVISWLSWRFVETRFHPIA